MLFLKTVSILVQLKESKDLLIFGDQAYKLMPSSITKFSYDNVNWNRMLKYETGDLGKDITRSSYYKATYDLYLNTDKYELVVLAKKSFDEFVSKQDKFKKEFIPNLIKAINFNKEESDYEIPNSLFVKYLVEENNKDLKHIDNFIVNKDFDNKNNKYKFKKIYQLDDHNETIETKNGQYIIHIDAKELVMDSWIAPCKFIDLNNSLFYLNGYVPIGKEKACLNIKVEDKRAGNGLKDQLKGLIDKGVLKD